MGTRTVLLSTEGWVVFELWRRDAAEDDGTRGEAGTDLVRSPRRSSSVATSSYMLRGVVPVPPPAGLSPHTRRPIKTTTPWSPFQLESSPSSSSLVSVEFCDRRYGTTDSNDEPPPASPDSTPVYGSALDRFTDPPIRSSRRTIGLHRGGCRAGVTISINHRP